MQRAFSRADLSVLLAGGVMALCVGMVLAEPGERGSKLQQSFSNLGAIAQATEAFRLDHAGNIPWDGVRGARQNDQSGYMGWVSWFSGGKNVGPEWGGWFQHPLYDVEAADRPLNQYVYPNFTFFALPYPLPRNHPARNQQAKAFQDPADGIGHQQRGPAENSTGTSCYQDVGTSYLFNTEWWEHLQIGGFTQRMTEARRRFAAGEGVDPARFVYYADEFLPMVVTGYDPSFAGNHGSTNSAVSLFADGHAGLIRYYGRTSDLNFTNDVYTLVFEGAGRPANPGNPSFRSATPPRPVAPDPR